MKKNLLFFFKNLMGLGFLLAIILHSQTVFSQPANDLCENAITIDCNTAVTGSNVNATNTGGPTASCGDFYYSPDIRGVWYKYIGTGGTTTIETCGGITNFDTQLVLFTGTCGALTCINGNDDACGVLSSITFSSTACTEYYIYICGYLNSAGDFTLTTTCSETNTLQVINCPAPVTQFTDAGICFASVSVPIPQAGVDYTGGCSVVVTNSYNGTNNASGQYPPGTTIVDWFFNDMYGQSATCQQSITVIDNEAPTIICAPDISVNCNPPVGIIVNPVSATSTVPPDYATNITNTLNGVGLSSFPSLSALHQSSAPGNCFVVMGTSLSITYNLGDLFNIDGFTFWNQDGGGPGGSGTSGIRQVSLFYSVDNVNFFPIPGAPTEFSQKLLFGNNPPEVFSFPSVLASYIRIDVSSNWGHSHTGYNEIAFSGTGADCGATVAYASPVGSDNCSYIITQTEGLPSGSLFPVGVTTNSFEIEDGSGATANCSFTVSVTDNIAPTITCPADVTVDADVDLCTASGVDLGIATASDNCSGFIVSNDAVEPYAVGSHVVFWTVQDDSGNSATCNQLLTVVDNQPPSITCPSDVTVPNDAGVCVATGVDLGVSITTDNCAVLSVVNDAAEPFTTGTTVVTWTVTDVNGLTNTCQQTVTVVDTELPGITCPADRTANNTPGSCEADLPNCSDQIGFDGYFAPANWTYSVQNSNGVVNTAAAPASITITSGDGGVGSGNTNYSIPIQCNGTINFTWSYSTVDGAPYDYPRYSLNNGVSYVNFPGYNTSGGTAQNGTASIPVIAGQIFVLNMYTTDNGYGPATVVVSNFVYLNAINPIVADNCGIASVLSDHPSTTYPVGVTPVLWTVTDVNGNPNTCIQNVTVTDVEAPTITCPADLYASADIDNCYATGVDLGLPVTADNCAVLSVVNDAVEPFMPGPTLITWTVTDVNGLVNTCQHTLTVGDDTPPTITCPADINVSTDAGLCTASAMDLGTPVTFDNCGIAAVINDAPVAEYPIGATIVNWTISDVNGLTNSCQQTVTVSDTELPSITCPADINTIAAPGLCSVSGIDLGMPVVADNCGIAIMGNDASEPYAVGVNTITWQVFDVHGNDNTCQQIVTVVDDQDPVITCGPSINAFNDSGECQAFVNVPVIGTPFCNQMTGFIYDYVPSNWTLTNPDGGIGYADDSGAPGSITLHSGDNETNTTSTTNYQIVVSCDGTISFDWVFHTYDIGPQYDPVGYFLNGTTVQLSDNAGGADQSGSVSIPVQAGDLFGFYASSDNWVMGYYDASYIIASNFNAPSLPGSQINDNCGILGIVNDYNNTDDASDYYPVGTTTITWTVTDLSGNTNTCTQDIVVTDNEAPVVTCSPDQTQATDPGICEANVVVLPPADVDDNCGVASVVNSITGTDNASAVYPKGATAVTWTVTDIYGNTGTCVQTINVADEEYPTITLPADISVSAEAGVCGATISYAEPIAGDNCPLSSGGILSQTTSQDIIDGNSVLCASGAEHAENRFFRVYDLAAMGIVGDINVESVGFGVQYAVGVGGTQSLEARLYSLAGTLDVANLTLIASQSAEISDMALGYFNIPVSAVIPENTVLVVELYIPDGIALGNQFMPGSNNLGQSGPTYIITSPCGFNNFADMAGIGFPDMHIVLNLHLATSGQVQQIAGLPSGSLFPVGTTTNVFEVNDAAGNITTESFDVTVIDNELPEITCPVMVSVAADADECTASGVDLGLPVTSDNCAVLTVSNNASEPFPIGDNTVVWTVVDVNGNENTCEQIVHVFDNQPPAITCPENITVSATTGLCSASGIELGTPVATDNCGVASVSNNASEPYTVGDNIVVWTVTDVHGLTNTCEQTITVVDDELPLIACPENVTQSVDPGLCTATGVDLGTPTFSDNCGVLIVNNDAVEPYFAGENIVIWTVADVNGNSNTCQQTVSIIENELPSIVCPEAISVVADPGLCSASGVDLGIPVVNDNCGILSVEHLPTEPFSTGINTVVWTVTDLSGNTNTCEQLVTVIDDQLPVITCPEALTASADMGECTASMLDLGTPVTTDNCDVQSVVNDAPETFAFGANTVTWLVTDVNGNENTCEQLVTVTDDELPLIACPDNVVVSTDEGICTATGVELGTPVYSDNCGVSIVENDAVEPYTTGETIVTWTITDINGNINTCEQLVTVNDTELPAITCPSDVEVSVDEGICTASGFDLGTPITSDNCGVDIVASDAEVLYVPGIHTITWTVLDVNGNVNSCQQTLTVIDDQLPVITCPEALTASADMGECTASMLDLGTPVTTDNCDVQSVVNDAPETFAFGATTVTWLVTDVNGNENTCEQLVTVTDDELPLIACPDNVVVSTDEGICTASIVELGTPVSSDNCGVLSVENDAVEPYMSGETIVTWTITDINGNINTCEQLVTVNDTELPAITCPPDVEVSVDEGICTASGIDLGIAVTTDNCGVASLSNDAPEMYMAGTTVVVWTVTDVHGNENTCEQLVIVNEDVLPEITCPENLELNADQGFCYAYEPDLGVPVATDNCGVFSVVNDADPYVGVGETVVTWTVTDNAGNTATCTQTVIVNDVEIPQITCPETLAVSTDLFTCTASDVELGTPITSDNCAVALLESDAADTYEIGSHTIVWTVTDNAGNMNTCEQTLTVTDDIVPTIECPEDVTVFNDPGETFATNVDLGTPVTDDNCGVATVENDAVEPYPIGVTIVTWTVTDNNGNTASCQQVVTVDDDTFIDFETTPDVVTNFLRNNPNPFRDFTDISFGIATDGKISLSLIDVSGKTVVVLINGEHMTKGVYGLHFDAVPYNLSPGMYYLRLSIGRETIVNKAVVF